LDVEKLTPEQWRELSEDAHKSVFQELRPKTLDRIDYALLAVKNGRLHGYCTVRELDSDSVYWQYGGAFPGTHSTAQAVHTYRAFVEDARAQYKRVTTLVKNDNIRYLRLAFACGFRIIGTRFFDGEIFVELLLDFTKENELCGHS
jgi:RimJ/RimL family protein N-acetyltransferase